MQIKELLIGLLIIAGITYLCRIVSIVLVKKKITNEFLLSFLYYIPYSVLTIMVFPKVFFSTASLLSAIIGAVVAIVLAFRKKGLMVVAVSSIVVVYLVELVMTVL
ncbi:MAG: AzlD domain-containing protein [Clostridia bacterium]